MKAFKSPRTDRPNYLNPAQMGSLSQIISFDTNLQGMDRNVCFIYLYTSQDSTYPFIGGQRINDTLPAPKVGLT